MKRLMIVADNSFANQAIRLALRQTAAFQIVGLFDGCNPVRSSLRELQPDVVVIDDMQEADNVLARLREITAETPEAKSTVLMLQMASDRIEQYLATGAASIISKAIHPVALGTLLREIAYGNIVANYRPAKIESDCPLTDRELEILKLAALGYTNSRIARELWVTEQTVKFHLTNTYCKFGVANRTEASWHAYRHGFLEQNAA